MFILKRFERFKVNFLIYVVYDIEYGIFLNCEEFLESFWE